MTTLDMQHLKMVVAVEEDLATLIFLVLSQIYLKIFLVKDLEVEAGEEEKDQIEDQI